jgi:hypothetical protein
VSGFLYYVAGDQRPVTKETVAKWGLAYAFPGSIEGRPCNHNSMTGSQGYVFGDPARQGGKAVGMYADEQTWRKLPTVEGRPELWVGYYNEAKPTPSDLQREKLLRGPKIRLADDNAWQIPIVRRFDDAAQRWESELPAYLDYDDVGKLITGAPLREYSHLWDVTAPLADARFMKDVGEEASEVTEQQVVAAVVALVQANYVVALPELIALGALQESDLAMIAMVACRYEALVGWLDAIQKKTSVPSTPAGAITSAGEAA